jgi:thiamine biosynthesis protein ThiS
MEIVVNGVRKSVDGGLTLAQFIEQLGMKGDRVAIERNREIAPRTTWSTTKLEEGDELEIVHFVGGGKMN